MSEISETIIPVPQETIDSESVFDTLLNGKSPLKNDSIINNLTANVDSSDDENGAPVKSVRRRIKRFSDSDSESEADKENILNNKHASEEESIEANISETDKAPRKSRLITNSDSSEGSDDQSEKQDSRIGNKRNKLHEKFKGLLNSRSKVPEVHKNVSPTNSGDDGGSSDDSGSGIESIKQKIKQKSMLLKSGICDPDTSSDEDSSRQQQERKKKVQKQKSTILISPKPARMSAKQAMENMQKIKSESNRMLREKEVSLPYHRSKALSLKDIMSRRKTAMSADGKVLPIKMNNDQLKQYVKLLEQRNKEMMELCKSDTEEDEPENADEQNSESHTEETKESVVNNSVPVVQEVKDALPPVNMAENINDEELPELTVEIQIQKNSVNLEQQSNENTSNLFIEITHKEQDKSGTDSAEKDHVDMKDISDDNMVTEAKSSDESQLIELHYDTEKLQSTEDLEKPNNSADMKLIFNDSDENVSTIQAKDNKTNPEKENTSATDNLHLIEENKKDESQELNDNLSDDFSDADINMDDLDNIIENAKKAISTEEDAMNSPMLIRDPHTLNMKPKLTGAPGMVIDLDGSNPVGPRKLTGVELLKERFTYFAKLKTPEEKERERESRIMPGMQHLKLRQELEDKISEQRSLEWAKRLEDEKQQQMEMDAIRGDESDADDIEKIEAKLEKQEEGKDEVDTSSESEEEEEEEELCDVKEKPRKKNPMIDDEAEVSDDDETGEQQEEEDIVKGDENEDDGNENNDEDDDESDESSDETSEDEEENPSKPKKGRILKAFEDSDDENATIDNEPVKDTEKETATDKESYNTEKALNESQSDKDSQDVILPLAQTEKSISEDILASQGSIVLPSPYPKSIDDMIKFGDKENSDFNSQTQHPTSILKTSDENYAENVLNVPDKLDIICETQQLIDGNLDDIVGMCSGRFTQTQNVIPAESQFLESQSQCTIGDDVLELCTGKFYDNQFVSQTESTENYKTHEILSPVLEQEPTKKPEEEDDLLDSIIKEKVEPVNEVLKTKKYVFDNAPENEAVSFDAVNHVRKKFIIDSDEESNGDAAKPGKKKKLKKRKPEQRALQISDDEEDEEEQLQSDEEMVEYTSDVEDDGGERIVEYDSEENEIEVKPQKQKKTRKMAEFFEQEAELTSEDEWVGSGDEDEAGLDRMEREAGDDDTFNQGQLQRELGQIHMRDVLDQDKREVRLIQELLFEDGDLGDGHRQRKFRWKNIDGEEETGDAPPVIFGDSQEEEFESEEQWRKQRHEREVFLRNMKENETEDKNISIDRSKIIKANLCSKTMSSLLLEVDGPGKEDTPPKVEKKPAKEETCPAMPLQIFQQSYHGSLLTRGRGSLARLAALAMPLASEADDDKVGTVGPSSKRNFVFTSVTPTAKTSKVTKRKAENVNVGTPRLIKKLRTDDSAMLPKSSLLDHLTAL